MNEKIATLSQRLQQVLTERNLKQADLVKITGLRKQQINQYVNGEFTAKPEKLFMIAKALDVSDQWLAGYDVSIERIVDEPFDRWESTFNPNGVLAREVTDKETQMKIIGKNIKTRREELDMTQDELAAKLGYTHRSAINKIELGINNFPMSKIKDFAAALQTSTDRLLGEITDEPAASKAYYTVKKLLTDNLRGGEGQNPEFSQFAGNFVDSLIKLVYGEQAVDLLALSDQLNSAGKRKVKDYMDDLTRLDEYTVQLSDESPTSVQD